MKGKPLILMLEDSEEIRYINRKKLEESGYAVCGAATLAQARAVLEKIRPQLYLLDVELPDGSGLELCRELRRRGDGAPVLFLSGSKLPQEVARAYAAGASLYMTKPYSLKELLREVDSLLGKGGEGETACKTNRGLKPIKQGDRYKEEQT